MGDPGRAERHELAASILQPLAEHQREERPEPMRTVERLIATSLVEGRAWWTPRSRNPSAASARTWPSSTAGRRTAGSSDGAPPPIRHQVRPPLGAFVVAYLRGEPIGCGAVKHHPWDDVTDIKRMWIAELARGLGLGRRLLEHLEGLAREHGSREARLETGDAPNEAIALYRFAGYREVPPFNDEPFADRWFAKPLLAG